MATITKFAGVSNYGDPLISDVLETSVHMFLQNAFLNIGAFTNIEVPNHPYSSGIGSHGYQPYKLRPSRDPRFQDGRVWEGIRSDWVWESGVEYAQQPIQISGVFIDNAFYQNTNIGTFGFKINYPEGKIVFNTPISTSATVKCSHSYRNVKIASSDANWFQSVQFDSFRGDDIQFRQKGSGTWDILSLNRVQLPAIVLESLPAVNMKAYEIGAINRVHYQDMYLHVLSETPWDRKQIHDIIVNQWQKRISGIRKKELLRDKKYPLNYDGSLAPSGISYNQMVNSYFWQPIVFEKIRSQEQLAAPPMFGATLRITFSIDSV
jgi:hypothetical protein